MFFQRLGTPSMSNVSEVFEHSRFGACLRRRAASLACVSMLALGNFAVGQSNRLKQTASISDIPLTSRGAPASIVTDPGANGVVYIVNSDDSVLPIDGGDGRIPATDASANCSFAEPPGGQAEHIEATDINGGAAAVVMQDKIYSNAGRAGVQVLGVALTNSCQTATQIVGTESAILD